MVAAEAAEHLRVNHAEPRAGEHRNGQLRHHGHLQRYPVARLQAAEVAQDGSEFVDADEKLLIRDVLDRLVFRLGHEMDRCLVLVPGEVAIDAVVASIDLAADEPAPEGRIAGVKGPFPVLVPVEEVGELLEALGEFVEGKTLEDAGVSQVGLGDELVRGGEIALLRPMHRDLRLGDIGNLLLCGGAWRLVF